MQRMMLKSKIHRATVTDSDLHYIGSITLDPDLMEAADIREFEQVAVLDIDNGERFETYAITGERGSGEVKVNGAAARLVHRGDTVIVLTYAAYDGAELDAFEPRVVHVDERNRAYGSSPGPVGTGIRPSTGASTSPRPSKMSSVASPQ
jgi:aspartate 1-decarboxylase